MPSLLTLLRLLKRTLLAPKNGFARRTPKRFFLMARVIPLFIAVHLIHWISFLIDEILFAGYRKVAVSEPVFIVGIPRSGTTFLHRVLSMDTRNFTSTMLWELVFAPSVIQRKVWMAVGAVDAALGGLGRRLLEAFERRFFESTHDVHKLSLFIPEEDDWFMTQIYASPFLIFPFPFPELLWHLTDFDAATPPADKKRIMAFYKTCLQRHLYVHGPEKRFLSKNPCFSSRIDSIDEHFPDAKVICTVRRPFEAIPSYINFMAMSWNGCDNDPKGTVFRDKILEVGGHWYRRPMQRLCRWPENRHAFLIYDTLAREPERTVIELYKRLGWETDAAFAERLAAEDAKAKAYQSRHDYSLEDFGLTPEQMLSDFGDVFERFGFSKQYDR